ncbi:MAG: TldD/PmbA family protein [Gemmatimonadetes bacterium]|nr:TldD/PmbA family protein [Gemmatimonadota bacterium]
MADRREFVKQAGVLGLALTVDPGHLVTWPVQNYVQGRTLRMDAVIRDLLMEALNAAKLAGASYADVRIGRQRQSSVQTREHQIVNVGDFETSGCGVRAVVDGCWGFAATPRLTKDGVARTAREAAAIAKANRLARDQRVELAAAQSYADASWRSDYTIDPWDISLEEKTDLLLRANAEALKVANVRFVNSGLSFVKDERNFASTDGSVIIQEFIRCQPSVNITAVASDFTDFQSRANIAPPAGRGWEYVKQVDLLANMGRWAEEAAAKLKAKSVDVGRYDLILHPSHLWLTIHESIGHSTELDRAMGYEANYAGTSFLAPPQKMLGAMKIGSELMNIRGDRSQKGAVSTIGYDDEGVQPDDFTIVKNGVLNDYQTTREQANWIKWWYDKQGTPTRSHGCSYAQNWSSVQFQRMPNVSLLPGEKAVSWDDLIAATENGIAIIGDGSFSIDQQRYNAQFGGQVFYEIKNGKVAGMLKDVAYQLRTPDFWSAMDLIGGAATYELHGALNDGKGQPGQSNAAGHGAVPARFRQQNVINTGRRR